MERTVMWADFWHVEPEFLIQVVYVIALILAKKLGSITYLSPSLI